MSRACLLATLAGGALWSCGPGDSGASSTGSSEPGVSATPGEPWFEEVGERWGLEFDHVSGKLQRFRFPEIMGGGVGLLDYDGDGWCDVYFVQSGDLDPSTPDKPAKRLYRNLGGGRFEDVTLAAGVGDTGYGMGCACADYDGDGDTDLYVTNVGPDVLYQNNGDGTFTDVTKAAGLGDSLWGTSASFLDLDGDGRLDLYITNYIAWSPASELDCHATQAGNRKDYCPPTAYKAPVRDTLYRNLGGGLFEDVSEAKGLGAVFGNGMGVACADYDGDGRSDVFVANDGMPNQLWMNQGDGKLVDRALISGCAVNENGQTGASMGTAVIDLEGDGDFDLFVTHLRGEMNTFYTNKGGVFDDTTAALGLAAPSRPYTGFGCAFADFDHDADLDFFVANGRVTLEEPFHDPEDPYAEPNVLMECGPGLRFKEVLPRGGTSTPLVKTSRGVAVGDLDNDGALDLVVMNKDARVHVLRNLRGGSGHWILLRITNEAGSDAIGATVRIRAGGREQWRLVQPGFSYLASNDARVHFGLGATTRVDEVLVRFPGGQEEVFGPFEADMIIELKQGSSK